jgi:hypothetical protein
MPRRKVEASLMGIGVGTMGVGGVIPSVVGVGVYFTSNIEAIEFPVAEFGFIQSEPNTSISEGKPKIPLLEELNVSNEHMWYFVVGFHLLPFVIDG